MKRKFLKMGENKGARKAVEGSCGRVAGRHDDARGIGRYCQSHILEKEEGLGPRAHSRA